MIPRSSEHEQKTKNLVHRALNFMTQLNYLLDTHLFESESVFLEIKENGKGKAVILDETIFYPQGGGQPADQGTISDGQAVFNVNDVRIDEEGVVWHYGYFDGSEFKKGAKVRLTLDVERRLLNSKLHSAGHLIDCAIEKMGLLEKLPPGKAFQFPPTPYIEYDGVVEDLSDRTVEIQKIVDEFISKNIPVKAEIITPEDAQNRGIYAPKGKPARIVTFEGFLDSGCGGTHVSNSSEIGKIEISKIKIKDGKTKIYFLVN